MSEDNVTNEVVYLHSTISSCFSNNDIDADSIVAIKRDWLEKYLCETNVADNPITLKEFLDEYNSEDTNEIMASAILEDTTKVLFDLDKRTNRMTFRNADTNEVMFVTSPVLCSEWNDASGKQCLSFVTCTGSNYKVLI